MVPIHDFSAETEEESESECRLSEEKKIDAKIRKEEKEEENI